MTDLEKALENQDVLALLTGAVNIKGILHSEISMSGGSMWSNEEAEGVALVNSAVSGVQSFVQTLFPEAAQRMPALFNAQARLATAASSASWAGSSVPEFNLDMIFVSVSGQDVRKEIAKLQECIYPADIQIGAGGLGAIVVAPLGFRRGGAKETAGRIAIKLGRVIKTSQIFVVTSVDARLSQSVTTGGLPLYAQAVVSLKASRMVDAKEVKSWLS